MYESEKDFREYARKNYGIEIGIIHDQIPYNFQNLPHVVAALNEAFRKANTVWNFEFCYLYVHLTTNTPNICNRKVYKNGVFEENEWSPPLQS